MADTSFSKKCLFEALIRLSEKKPYKDITVTEICDESGYNRSTFYRYYADKKELLEDGFTDEVKAFFSGVLVLVFAEGGAKKALPQVFAFIRKNFRLFVLMHEAGLDLDLMTRFREPFSLEMDNEIEKKYYLQFFAAGFYAIMIRWLEDGMKESDEEMGRLVYEMDDKFLRYVKRRPSEKEKERIKALEEKGLLRKKGR